MFTNSSALSLETLRKVDNSGNVRYRGTTFDIQIPTEYLQKDREFRAAWVSYLIGSLPAYNNQTAFANSVNTILNVLEYYNINAIIFHVRTHHNISYYNTDLNIIHSSMNGINWNTFDPLEYIINESHKRGIEFHAWLNPYRIVTNSTQPDKNEYAKTWTGSKPGHILARNPDNLLVAPNGSVYSYILNPGEPAVREFLVDSCMELVERYKVDAIHFDDYFYISGLTSDMDATTRAKYNPTSLGWEDWRRRQVDLLIEDIHNELVIFNQQNNRHVQLGISPSGIYRNVTHNPGTVTYTYNSNGDLTSPTGNNTSGFAHYGSYLYSDTLKWINNEWIDYIVPQTYWSLEHPSAGYADCMDWWNAAVRYKKVNLYSGIGLYMNVETGNTYSWQTNPNEFYNQLRYGNKFENVDGYSVYSYNNLLTAFNNKTSSLGVLAEKVKADAWKTKVLLPVMKLGSSNVLPHVTNIIKNSSSVSWSAVSGAKFYAIYRSTGEVKYTADELLYVTSLTSYNTITTSYNYGIRAISAANVLGAIPPTNPDGPYTVNWYDGTTLLKSESVDKNSNATPPANPSRTGFTFIGWNKTYNDIIDDTDIFAKFNVIIETDTSSNVANNGTEVTSNGGVPNGRTIKVGFTRCVFPAPGVAPFDSRLNYDWTSSNLSVATISIYGTINALSAGTTTITGVYKSDPSITGSIEITVYNTKLYTVNWYDGITLLKTEQVDENKSASPPTPPIKEGYTFKQWDKLYSSITSDLDIYTVYEKTKYTILWYDGTTLLKSEEVEYLSSATPPTNPSKTGYTFSSWDKSYSSITIDLSIYAIYEINKYTVEWYSEGILLKSEEVEYLSNATPPTNPSKTGYTFSSWDKSYSNITNNITINALYTINSYIVNWYNGEELLKIESIVYLSSATPPIIPTIEGYTFSMWSVDYTSIIEDTNIYAIFIAVTYIVLWYSEDTLLKTEYVEYLTSATPPTPPTKLDFVFKGWDKDYSVINGPTTIYAIFEYAIYTINWYSEEVLVKSENVAYGNSASPPTYPSKIGYTFKSWDKAYNNISSNLDIFAVFEINSYTVNWYNETSLIKTELVTYLGSAITPTNPSKIGYTFKSWDKAYNNISSNLDIFAVFEINSYTVNWFCEGVLLKSEEVLFNNSAVPPLSPSKVGYTFKSWDRTYNNISGNTNINAIFEVNSYTVNWYNESVLIKTEKVNYLNNATPPLSPSKIGYTFKTWSTIFNSIDKDTNIYAVFEINSYVVNWFSQGELLKTEIVNFLESASPPLSPTLQHHTFNTWDKDYSSIISNLDVNAVFSTNSYTVNWFINEELVKSEVVVYNSNATPPTILVITGYTFISWDKLYNNVDKNLDIYAIYETNYYTVNWYVEDNLVKVEKVAYSKNASVPIVENKVGYTFVGWNTSYLNIIKDTNIYAVYEINTYTVNWYEGEKLIKSEEVIFEQSATAPNNEPIKEGFSFVGWDKIYTNITKSTNIYAVYEINTYTVNWYINLVLLFSDKITHGSSATPPCLDIATGYEFLGWDKDYNNIISDLNIYGEIVKVNYVVNWYSDGLLVKTENVLYQDSALAPIASKDGYQFISWDVDYNSITTNTNINAVFLKIYWVSFIVEGNIYAKNSALDGRSVDSVPANPTKSGYVFKNWDKDLTNITEDIEVNAVFVKIPNSCFGIGFGFIQISMLLTILVVFDIRRYLVV